MARRTETHPLREPVRGRWQHVDVGRLKGRMVCVAEVRQVATYRPRASRVFQFLPWQAPKHADRMTGSVPRSFVDRAHKIGTPCQCRDLWALPTLRFYL